MECNSKSISVRTAESAEDVDRCFPVMHELRPHVDFQQFRQQVGRQGDSVGYKLAFVQCDGKVTAVAGFRVVEMLAWGVAMYVDDLVTTEACRSLGHGGRLFDWLVNHARELGCHQLHLDSGVQRFGAHRFYLHKRMDITSHHFSLRL